VEHKDESIFTGT
jgi:hypothetical protein